MISKNRDLCLCMVSHGFLLSSCHKIYIPVFNSNTEPIFNFSAHFHLFIIEKHCLCVYEFQNLFKALFLTQNLLWEDERAETDL